MDVGENVIVWDIVIFPLAYIINITDYDDKSNEAIVENRTETNAIEEHICVEVENVREGNCLEDVILERGFNPYPANVENMVIS